MTRRLLIADDDATLRRLLRMLIERDGRFTVVAEAMDGVEAMDMIERFEPDVLLLDLAMPRLDGIGVLEKLQGRSRPVVAVLTGFNEATLRQQVLDAGAAECFEKGSDFAALCDQLVACFVEAEADTVDVDGFR